MALESDHASVQLPVRMEAGDLVTLRDEIDARFDAVRAGHRKGARVPEGCPRSAEIPAVVAAVWKRFDGAVKGLAARAAGRAAAPSAAGATDAPSAANEASDEAWRAFESWLLGWTKHRDDGRSPGAADAHALYQRLFPPKDGGLRFITWRPRKQWDAMKPRMAALAEPGAAATVAGLGGDRLVAALRATHQDFGAAFGFSLARGDAAPATVDARSEFLAAKDALRELVKKVEGSADEDVEGSEALARWLLGPFNAMVAEFAARPVPRAKPAPAPAGPTT